METDSLPNVEKMPPKLRWYQYRLRSLFLLTLLVAIGMSYVTVTIQDCRKEKSATEAIYRAGAVVTIHKTWLGKLLQDDSLVRVIGVKFPRWSTDNVLVHLHGLNQLRELQLQDTEITDAGLANLQGLSQLQRLSLNNTNVTDQGVKKLVQALPNCEIRLSAM